MKKLTSLAISLILSLSAVSSMTVSAETEEAVPRYTYLELMEMSDEQIIKEFGIDEEYLEEIGFGNDAISDEQKFKNYWPDIWSGIEYYEDERYMWREAFLNGEYTPYFRLHVSDDVNLDFSLTAHDFGFPEEWEIRFNRGSVGYDEGFGDYRYYYGHEYKIGVPVEVYEDFETYFRLELAGSFIRDIFSDYSIEYFSTPADAMAPDGRVPAAVVPGDVNDTDTVDISDAIALMAYATNSESHPLTDLQLLLGDVYQQGDGIGINDAASIQKYLTKQIDALPESMM